MQEEYLLSNLGNIMNKIENGKYQEAIDELQTNIKINRIVTFYLSGHAKFTQDSTYIIRLIITILQIIYNNSTVDSPVSDENYDKLYELYRNMSDDEIVGSVTIDDAHNKIITNHKYPDLRGTLDKIHYVEKKERPATDITRKSFEEWMNSCENKLGRKLTPEEREAYLFPKWDGVSIVFENLIKKAIEKALTRGKVELNEAVDLTHIFKIVDFNNINDTLASNFGVKTEVVMSDAKFEEYIKKYGEFKNPRSAVNSILSLSPSEFTEDLLEYLTVIPLRVQDGDTGKIYVPQAVYKNYPFFKIDDVRDYDLLRNKLNLLKDYMDEYFGIRTDGVVIQLINPMVQEKLGREKNINKFEVAFKFPAESKKTTLLNVEMSVGNLGAITPVAKVVPVKMKGNKIESISLGSPGRLAELGLKQGDEVIIKYDIIPYLEIDDSCKRGSGDIYAIPHECPECGRPLAKDPNLRCVNNYCESRVRGKILNYVNKMAIPNISEGTIKALYINGLLNGIEDLYRMEDNFDKIIELNGFGKKGVTKIIKGIKSRTEVYDYKLLGSLGIPSIGERIFKKVLNIYNIDELIKICEKDKTEKLTTIGGIEKKIALKIIEGIKMNKKLLRFLRSVVRIRKDERTYTIKVLFTKVRDKKFAAFLDAKGVMVLDNYNKHVNIVITKDKETDSSKVKEAREDGKMVITIKEAYEMFDYKE